MEALRQVIAALYVALGEAAGGPGAMRIANRVLRDAIVDRVVDDPAAVALLESLSHDEDDALSCTRTDSAAIEWASRRSAAIACDREVYQ